MPRKKENLLPFDTSKFLSETSEMSFVEKGIYINMICIQHINGFISTDEFELLANTDKIKNNFVFENGGYINPRIQDKIIKRSNYIESRKKNATSKNEKNLDETLIINVGIKKIEILLKDVIEVYNKASQKKLIPLKYFTAKTIKKFKVYCEFNIRSCALNSAEELLNKLKSDVELASTSDFLTGHNKRDFIADFNFIIDLDYNQSLRSGKYTTRVRERFSDVDTDEAFELALKRTYGENWDIGVKK